MSEKKTQAADSALELMKQLIALSSGALVLSATFIKEFGSLSWCQIINLALAWLLLVLSVVFGLETLSAIVKSKLSAMADWSEGWGKASAMISKYCFILGMVCFIVFAFTTLIPVDDDNATNDEIEKVDQAKDRNNAGERK